MAPESSLAGLLAAGAFSGPASAAAETAAAAAASAERRVRLADGSGGAQSAVGAANGRPEFAAAVLDSERSAPRFTEVERDARMAGRQ